MFATAFSAWAALTRRARDRDRVAVPYALAWGALRVHLRALAWRPAFLRAWAWQTERARRTRRSQRRALISTWVAGWWRRRALRLCRGIWYGWWLWSFFRLPVDYR